MLCVIFKAESSLILYLGEFESSICSVFVLVAMSTDKRFAREE